MTSSPTSRLSTINALEETQSNEPKPSKPSGAAVMQNSHSAPPKPIGAVFTPLRWAKWLVDQTDLHRRWAEGATVCDPTAGNGAFAYALMDCAMAKGIEVDDKMLSRLYLIEQ